MAELIRTASAGSEDSGDVQVTVSPAQELRPVYLRAPQAERERNARLNREEKA